MMMTQQWMVQHFHEAFSLRVASTPNAADWATRQLRVSLINEEAQEFQEAALNSPPSLIGMADALADLMYVVLGAAVSLGIDLEQVFKEVHASNLTKLHPDGTVHHRADGKVLKPSTYKPADIRRVLRQQGAQPHDL